MPDAHDLPDYVRPDMAVARKPRERSRTLAAGTDAVHLAATKVLPQWEGETPDAYTRRATLTEFADFYGRTIEAAVGLLFGAELSVEGELPAALAVLEANADGHGTSLHATAKACGNAYLLDGWCGLLADFPRVADPTSLSVRDVQEQALRPYLLPITASQVLSWRTTRRGAEVLLTQLVLEEVVEVDAGKFGVVGESRYRVYRHDPATDVVSVAVYRIVDVAGQKAVQEVEPESPLTGPKRIPLAVAGDFTAQPPLDRLAWLNVGHYRVSADHRALMSVCHAPTFVIEEADPSDTNPIHIGVNGVLRLTGTQKAKWLQADADALQSAERTMERQSQQAAALGMAFLARDKSGPAETATGRSMDASADRATLGMVADKVGALVTEALAYAASFVGGPAVPVVSVVPDYDVGRMDAQTIAALSALATAGQISLATLLEVLQNGDVLPDGLDLQAEALAAQSEADARLMRESEMEPDVVEVAA